MKASSNHHANQQLNHLHFFEDDFSCKIFPNLGGSLHEFNYKGIKIIKELEPFEEAIAHSKKMADSAFLFPFPNRLEDGQYTFEGQTHQFPLNEPVHHNAIHGFLSEKCFEVLQFIDNTATLRYISEGEKGFPFPFQISIEYLFSSDSVSIEFTVKNTGNTNFPFGLGWHPYFLVEEMKNASIAFQPNKKFLTNERNLPDTEVFMDFTEIPSLNNNLDDAFEMADHTIYLKQPTHTIKLSAPNTKYVQLYVPDDEKSIAIEPMTCIANAFNNKIGLKTLKANATFTWNVSIKIETE